VLELIRSSFDYNYWANLRILSQSGALPEADLLAPSDLSHGSLMNTLEHILYAEWIWRMRIAEGFSPGRESPWETPLSFAALQTFWVNEESAMRAFLAGMKDEDLEKVVAYHSTSGKPYRNTLWQLLAHIVNHGTQHRSESAFRLTSLGHSPGDLDFILFLREKEINPGVS
jgi:uncharacterized damage-inducible protein DinB